MQFTPTYSPWLTLVDRWFGLLTERQLRRGAIRSTREREQTVGRYLARRNEDPKPLMWTKSAEEMLQALAQTSRRVNDSGHRPVEVNARSSRRDGLSRCLAEVPT